jgi:3-deoxy-D-manno-octulosonic acid kinase
VATDEQYQLVDLRREKSLVRTDLTDVLPGLLWTTGAQLPGAKGRGGVSVLSLKHGILAVARDYYRGGSLGFLLRKSYLDPERPQRELRLLLKLQKQGVPVVTPLAALARKQGLFYRLRLLTELLPGAMPLPAFLAKHPEHRRAAIEEAGRVVRLAFSAGLWHPDLHPDNLLARCPGDGQGPEVRLLDLDRGELRKQLTVAEQDRMLLRMARYLRRHEHDLPIEPTTQDHLRFLKGMGMKPEERHLRMRELAPLLRQELARHGIE